MTMQGIDVLSKKLNNYFLIKHVQYYMDSEGIPSRSTRSVEAIDDDFM